MNLREARFERRLTQFDLRLKTGIHQSKISNFEQGYIEPTEIEKKKLSKALAVKLSDIDWSGERYGRLG